MQSDRTSSAVIVRATSLDSLWLLTLDTVNDQALPLAKAGSKPEQNIAHKAVLLTAGAHELLIQQRLGGPTWA